MPFFLKNNLVMRIKKILALIMVQCLLFIIDNHSCKFNSQINQFNLYLSPTQNPLLYLMTKTKI